MLIARRMRAHCPQPKRATYILPIHFTLYANHEECVCFIAKQGFVGKYEGFPRVGTGEDFLRCEGAIGIHFLTTTLAFLYSLLHLLEVCKLVSSSQILLIYLSIILFKSHHHHHHHLSSSSSYAPFAQNTVAYSLTSSSVFVPITSAICL